jgi:hypothetical protein
MCLDRIAIAVGSTIASHHHSFHPPGIIAANITVGSVHLA